jgi:hypothetical protein
MPRPATALIRAAEDAPLHFALASMPTLWTRPTGIGFLLQGYIHPIALRFIGEHMANVAMGPLVELLIILGANI